MKTIQKVQGTKIRMTVDLSLETASEKQWGKIFKVLKAKEINLKFSIQGKYFSEIKVKYSFPHMQKQK